MQLGRHLKSLCVFGRLSLPLINDEMLYAVTAYSYVFFIFIFISLYTRMEHIVHATRKAADDSSMCV